MPDQRGKRAGHPILIFWDTKIHFLINFLSRMIFLNSFLQKEESALPLKALIFDEASLSSPDVYLSDFFSKSEYKLQEAFDEVTIDGSRFYFPSTFSFLMTFNFDEGTERLSPKFIDRVPILHCDHPEHEGVTVNKKKHKPFNSRFRAHLFV